ncbi:MAG TPA: type II toxin-antitoxin system VapC family toxin [Acetobacteraceae bacterium]
MLDASVTLAAVLQESNAAAAIDLLDRVAADRAAVPGHWHLEVGNALLMAERRRGILPSQRAAYVHDLLTLPIEVDLETSARAWRETASLAERHRLTLYDAAYLELGLRRGLPLATFDAALRRAASAAGLQLL